MDARSNTIQGNPNIRRENWTIADNVSFDVAIIGGGINGASIYKKLCQEGYKVLLLDKGDFSCGTSQASAMMIWGGLLYLKNLDLSSVYRFSKDRNRMIHAFDSHVRRQCFRYISNSEWGRNKYLVYLALQFYWALGKFRLQRPTFQTEYEELDFINDDNGNESILYQEGFLRHSDSRFVLNWILEHQTEDCLAINYCSIEEATYSTKERFWSLDLTDMFSSHSCTIRARMLVNCAGVWTDEVNKRFGIQSPYKHVYSKGVFIGCKRPDKHSLPLVFEMGQNGDALTFIPWGPISLWGPTETMETSLEAGYRVTPEDIHILLKHANRTLKYPLSKSRIVSLRCGLRPLAVENAFNAECYPLDISRRHIVVQDSDVPWISVYGGKISGCISMAETVAKTIYRNIGPCIRRCTRLRNRTEKPSWTSFPGLRGTVPAIDWCVRNEFCCTLEDYLRRRTNISQWIPREGLGLENNNVPYLRDLDSRIPRCNGHTNGASFKQYRETVRERFDTVMEQIQ